MNRKNELRNIMLMAMLFLVATIPFDVFLSTTYIVKSVIAGALTVAILILIIKEKKSLKK